MLKATGHAASKAAGSRKFWAMLVGVVTVIGQERFGITPEQMQYVVGVVAAYMGSQGLADFGKERK